MKSVLLVGSQHGNERLGDALYGFLAKEYSYLLQHVDYILANPEAHKQNIRLIETDMNRSYVDKPSSYEERQASKLVEKINQNGYDLVLDLHTTTCIQPPCFIVNGLKNEFLGLSHINKIVQMKMEMVQNSLIGVVPNALSIEVNENDINDGLLDKLAHDIERYVGGDQGSSDKELYVVDSVISKAEIYSEELINFAHHPAGFYPVLVGEAAYERYTNYVGFKARQMNRIRL